ncbi:hypothetical protein JTE90_009992 [Oedothorax gibbosus]|uniref:Large ribosomal subunit protein bL28m n=1 Tax=Oedothorax gibbosus TaxID=931172 RepID=A0AAV6UEI9_9ARAC|nr:hypothetical protein JTE90_009992 [Oedothorax gibbosus]
MYKFFKVKSLRPNPHSVQARLPEVYTKYVESLKQPPAPLHYIPETTKYKLDPEKNEKVRVENRDIPLKFPKEADEGIWGGEGVIQGFIKYKKKRRPLPNYWIPNLKKSVVYSEILNSYLDVTVTERTLKLIDEHKGFDHYILGTPVQDLQSQLALSIRRKLLLALVNKEKYHPDEETSKEVLEKYQKYAIPKEEAEWFGLTMREAVQKQRLLEEEIVPVPLKHTFRAKYLEELKKKASEPESAAEEEAPEQEESRIQSFISKMNPFAKKVE